jgi:hypothetical protein
MRYAKPELPFWLLIWTVCSDFHPFWIDDEPRVSPGVVKARQYITANGVGPFDEVWFLNLNLGAQRIWPEQT